MKWIVKKLKRLFEPHIPVPKTEISPKNKVVIASKELGEYARGMRRELDKKQTEIDMETDIEKEADDYFDKQPIKTRKIFSTQTAPYKGLKVK